MIIRRFEARDMDEAVKKIREAIGPDALLLSARPRKKGFPWRREEVLEVTAAVPPGPPKEAQELEALRREILSAPPQPARPWWVLVGPSGGGKTTLAGSLTLEALQEGKHPLLVAAGVYRAAALAQVRALALATGASFREAGSPRTLETLLQHPGGGVVDIPGFNIRQPKETESFRSWLPVLRGCRLVLVWPAPYQGPDAPFTLAAYRQLGIREALLTKVDETTHPQGAEELLSEQGFTLLGWRGSPHMGEPVNWERR
ncbi:MAG: hypothetical protein KM310_01870 [Clostridiales bacterium]|nr:hypothetical protein [Clostridiales bacterium]